MQLIAIKPFKYATRALKSGDLFSAGRADARILTTLRKARVVRESSKIVPPPAAVAAQIQQSSAVPPTAERGDDIEKLRTEAEALSISVDRRWGARRLQDEIDKVLAG